MVKEKISETWDNEKEWREALYRIRCFIYYCWDMQSSFLSSLSLVPFIPRSE